MLSVCAMIVDMTEPLLVVRHVPWEGPHRILDAFGPETPVVEMRPLHDDDALPNPGSVAGAVFMGGPMSVNDVAEHPGLEREVAWLREALACDVPVLGICLGSQLLARALGAEVGPAAAKELGWAPIEVADAADPLLGPLAPSTEVLHWHGEEFAVPPGAETLASSAATPCQAFRAGTAWGLLFHPEADGALVDAWLAEPSMAAEAREVLGAGAEDRLRAGAHEAASDLAPRSAAAFAAFAGLCRERAAA
jgi:GMP synthase (glutamine-hydrolysing)